MTSELIEKFVASKNHFGKAVNIHFKQRNTLTGLFIKENDYDELRVKNFWRIVTGPHIEQWKKTKDPSLARIFNGSEFTRLSETAAE